MDSTLLLALVSVFTPLAAFVVIFLFMRKSHQKASILSALLAGVAMVASWLLFAKLHGTPFDESRLIEAVWLNSAEPDRFHGLTLSFGFLLDNLNLFMLLIVTTIHFLIQVYSIGYMKGDPGTARYFACLSLFAWSMVSLVTASNLIQLFVFWELVGLTSYLLIGFWYEKFSASQAGKKAFVMTRIGDIGFFLGFIILMISLWPDGSSIVTGHSSLSVMALQNMGDVTAQMGSVFPFSQPTTIAVAGLLMFFGICGKSAQFPLHAWLPDAMEGPTPVSALLHSATMVAAGVYLFARLFGLFTASEFTLETVLFIATLTTLLASTMAMVVRDIKRVLAYSTISQLGFMLMGLAASGLLLRDGQDSEGIFAGMFHLTTHAGFKAMLFLSAGAFIHHYGTNDMFEIGKKGGKQLKVAFIALLVGSAALSGVPLFSGFFSKEVIIAELGSLGYMPYVVCGYVAAFLTPYYTFRMLFAVWTPKELDPVSHSDEDEHHGHGTAKVMAFSLLVLAVATMVLGWLGPQIKELLLPPAEHPHASHGFVYMLTHGWLAIVMVASGILLAWWEFGRKAGNHEGFIYKVPPLARLFENKWYIDDFYRWVVDHVIMVFARLCYDNDNKIVDAAADGIAENTIKSSGLLSRMQIGQVQYYLAIVFVVVAAVAFGIGMG